MSHNAFLVYIYCSWHFETFLQVFVLFSFFLFWTVWVDAVTSSSRYLEACAVYGRLLSVEVWSESTTTHKLSVMDSSFVSTGEAMITPIRIITVSQPLFQGDQCPGLPRISCCYHSQQHMCHRRFVQFSVWVQRTAMTLRGQSSLSHWWQTHWMHKDPTNTTHYCEVAEFPQICAMQDTPTVMEWWDIHSIPWAWTAHRENTGVLLSTTYKCSPCHNGLQRQIEHERLGVWSISTIVGLIGLSYWVTSPDSVHENLDWWQTWLDRSKIPIALCVSWFRVSARLG